MIKVDCISKYYGTQCILQNCQFSVAKGEIVGIMGESGSGKSTLARLIAGIEKVDGGQIVINGQTQNERKGQANIQMVFQDAYQSVNHFWTVEKILQEAKREAIPLAKLKKVLFDVELDETFLKKKPKELSGGQLQRICIARCVLAEPDIIIFDEALSGLDPIIQGKLLKMLYQLKEKYKQTYVFITHDFRQCYAICRRVLVINKGKILEQSLNEESDAVS